MNYQSPINLNRNETNKCINQSINIKGINKGAIYDKNDKVYYVQDEIILEMSDVKYKLIEYHFHIPAEHVINYDIYPAEIHYVFGKLGYPCKFNICSDEINHIDNKNIIVIGKVINDGCRHIDLTTLQVKPPFKYYEYDGTLTTGSYSPVRWIIDEMNVYFKIEDLIDIAKSSRKIQPNDNRIIINATNWNHLN
jgi:carbonic anhydrase